MNSNTHCELLTLNVGHSSVISREGCPEFLITNCTSLLGIRGTIFMLDGQPLLTREATVDGYGVTTLYDCQFGTKPLALIAEWFTAWDEESSENCWAAVQRAKEDFDRNFAEIGGNLNQIWRKSFLGAASCPLQTPWSVEIQFPHFLTSPPSIQKGRCSLWPPFVWAQIAQANEPQPQPQPQSQSNLGSL